MRVYIVSGRYLCAKERNLLLTELGWKRIPKDANEQIMRGIARGSEMENDPHRYICYWDALVSLLLGCCSYDHACFLVALT